MTTATNILDALVIPEDYPLDTLSYSSLAEMENCPLRWKYKYLDGITPPSAPWLVLGWHLHKAIEFYYKGVEDALPTVETMLRLEWEWQESKLNETIARLRRMFNAYTAGYPNKKVTVSEKRYEALVVGGTRLVCVVDLIEGDCLVDYKTRGADFTPDFMQLGISAAILRSQGFKITRGEIRGLRKDVTGARVPILSVFEQELTDEFIAAQLAEASSRVEEICARIRTDMWVGPPADENGQKKMCYFACQVEQCDWRNRP